MTFAEFTEQCRKGEPGAVRIIHTDEDFYLRECGKLIIDAMEKKHNCTPAVSRIPADTSEKKITAEHISSELQSGDMFTPARVVMVRDSWKVPSDKNQKKKEESPEKRTLRKKLELVVRVAEAPDPGTCLVFFLDAFDKRTKAAKAVTAKDCVVEFPKMYATPPPWQRNTAEHKNDFSQWVQKAVQKKGKRIDLRVANRIVVRAGTDLGVLSGEIEKLMLYIGEREEIRASDIDEIVIDNRRDDLFEIAETALSGNISPAIDLCTKVMNFGAYMSQTGERINNPAIILNILLPTMHKKLRAVWRALLLQKQKKRPDQIVKECGINRIFKEQFFEQVRMFPDTSAVAETMTMILACDRAVKLGRSTPLQAAEEMFLKMNLRLRRT